MKAIGYTQAGQINAPEALIEFETEIPELKPQICWLRCEVFRLIQLM